MRAAKIEVVVSSSRSISQLYILFDVKHLLIRIGQNQNVITRVEVQTGTDGDQ